MKKIIFASMGAIAMCAVALPVNATDWVIDFDTNSEGDLPSNTIFGAGNSNPDLGFQRYDNAAGGIPGSTGVGVTIRAESYFGWGEIDLAVGYDSTPGVNVRDPDLEAPFTPKTVSGVTPDVDGYRNILIVQSSEDSDTRSCATSPGLGGVCDPIRRQVSDGGGSDANNSSGSNSDSNGDGRSDSSENSGNNSDSSDTEIIVHRADDEAAGGKLYFEFDTAVDLTGMNVFDIEGNQGGKVYFWEEGEAVTWENASWLTMPTTHDNGVAFMDFGDVAQNIALMKVKFYGSGAIDNIAGDVSGGTPEVPEPGAAALFGIGLLGFAALRRRRKVTA